jgi:hypothetical protein
MFVLLVALAGGDRRIGAIATCCPEQRPALRKDNAS